MKAARHFAQILAIFALSALAACSGKGMSSDVVAQNEFFTVTGDSIIEHTADSDTIFALSENKIECRKQGSNHTLWTAPVTPTDFAPRFASQDALLDALYAAAAESLHAAMPKQTTRSISHTSLNALMATAYLDPEGTKQMLLTKIADGKIQRESSIALSSDRMAWAIAAWEVYKVLGDRKWLEFIRPIIANTLSEDQALLVNQYHNHFFHGAPFFTTRASVVQWMSQNDIFETVSAYCNVLYAASMLVLHQIDEELSEGSTDALPSENWDDAINLIDEINHTLWIEKRGFYSAAIYNAPFDIQANFPDNLAQAIAVLTGIAFDNRAENLMEQTPISHYGVPVNYVAINPINDKFTRHPLWPATQGLWNMAAASLSNEHMMRRGAASLLRTKAKSLASDEQNPVLDSAVLALIIRSVVGLRFVPEGIELKPCVPVCFKGRKQLVGFKYRNALFDFIIDGTGTGIQSIKLDGNPLNTDFLQGTLEGHHVVHIIMDENHPAMTPVSLASKIRIPIMPQVEWNANSGAITNYSPDFKYSLVINGKRVASIDSTFIVPELPQGLVMASVVAAAEGYGGIISDPQELTPAHAISTITVTADANSGSVTAQFTASESGAHYINVEYATETPLIVKLLVNTHHQSTLLLAPGSSRSSTNIVELLKGNNVITVVPAFNSADTPLSPTVTALRIVHK